ncbi:hypothetical protein FOCC_FOCC012624, partial [Frankliniella occidentalis]
MIRIDNIKSCVMRKQSGVLVITVYVICSAAAERRCESETDAKSVEEQQRRKGKVDGPPRRYRGCARYVLYYCTHSPQAACLLRINLDSSAKRWCGAHTLSPSPSDLTVSSRPPDSGHTAGNTSSPYGVVWSVPENNDHMEPKRFEQE